MRVRGFKWSLYITLLLSLVLLLYSLYLSSKSIELSSKMISRIESKYLKLSALTFKLNHDVEINESNVLKSIILKELHTVTNIQQSFNTLYDDVDNLSDFINDNSNNIDVQEVRDILGIIKRRIIGYKAVETSIVEALQSKDEVDLHDALLGFNAVTVKFNTDINKLMSIAKNNLKKSIVILEKENTKSSQTTLYSFLLALFLISLSIYKLIILQRKAQNELERAEKAEGEQRHLQAQLLKYNDDLEEEIARKSKELHQKIFSHFLTGLPNRNKLLEDIQQYDIKQMAILNIDKFQKFNDVYGEEIGNIALKMSAVFLKNHIDDEHTLLYHIGGDEFVLIVKNQDNLQNTDFIHKIENILKSYAKENFVYEDKQFKFMMSAGITFSGKKKMLAYADMALKDAKKKNVQLSVFNEDKELERLHQDDIECHKKLLFALDNNKILSFFQPIVPIQNKNKPIKYESLVRLEQEDGKILPPFSFINVAKANRIYHRLTRHVLHNTLSVISKYKIPASLNISMEDIENEATLKMLYDKFEEYEYNHLLTIELLETEEFKDYKSVYDFCVKVRSYSIKIALDDFGAGYSNFSHILHLPVDFIKIDASLISNIDRDQNSKIMVETIVGLAKKLHIETIAEFVSSKEILEIIKELNVDYAQGYYLGKPEKIQKHLEKKS